jgi:hypothetical protein
MTTPHPTHEIIADAMKRARLVVCGPFDAGRCWDFLYPPADAECNAKGRGRLG